MTIRLSTERAQATIDLDGGRLAGLTVDGLDLLVPETERPTRWGSFPMIPWCGRLPYGRLQVGDDTYHFPVTSPPHANHGLTHLQAWERVEVTGAAAVIATRLVEPWPFGGGAVQRFELTDEALVVTAEVHAQHEPMPVMAGWHPWFRRRLDRGGPARLHLEVGAHYLTDDDFIPTGELAPLPPPPWNICVTDVIDGPLITWDDALGHGPLELVISSDFDHWVVFTEPEHALCVEPQSGPPNQLNANPVVIDDSSPLIGSMTLAWG